MTFRWQPLALVPLALSPLSAQQQVVPAPAPLGILVDIGGGQRLHLNCRGTGAPAVVFESGAGDFSFVWSLVQPDIARRTTACSYDRGGYAWSDPGRRPRTYRQLALELHTALARAGVSGPYLLVGQSYGGLVARGFAAAYPREIAGMVLVDAAHEDQRLTQDGKPVAIRSWARGRAAPPPTVALDQALLDSLRAAHAAPAKDSVLDAPLARLSPADQRLWRWAMNLPLGAAARALEMDWSPEELARMHEARRRTPQPLGAWPLCVIERAPDPSDPLAAEHHAQQLDLARLSSRGRLVTAAHAGHNVHLEDPPLVIRAIDSVLAAVAGTAPRHAP